MYDDHCRGKQDLAFFEDRFVIKAAKSDVVVPTTAVQRVVVRGAPRRFALHLRPPLTATY